MRRVAAAATVISLVVAGVVASSPAEAAPPPAGTVTESGDLPAPIVWGSCADLALQLRGAQCGFLTVPLDYDNPRLGTIKLAVSRIGHKVPDAQYQGIMLTNPGGPGGSGLMLSMLGEFVPKGAGQSYDWIGFDPRGVGSSEPRLDCDGDYFGYNRPFYVPITTSLARTWLKRTRGYAEACDAAGNALLDHAKTTDTVADMESIRKALGEQKINFYGFSYGTYLGQVYATLHPDRVRRMVLDGNVDVRRIWYQANLDQDVGFDRNLKIFFNWVAKYDSVYHLGTTGKKIEDLFYAEQRKLLKAPAGGVIGADEWTDIFLSAGYSVSDWTQVASAFAGWVNDGAFDILKELFDEAKPHGAGADNDFAMYLATQCTDVKWPTSWTKWRQDHWRTYSRAPFETWGNARLNAPCRFWAAKAGRPVQVDGTQAPPILLIGETLDAATPFEGSLEARSRFPASVLIEGVGGTTHAGSLHGVLCTDDLVAAYLATGDLPERVSGRRSDVQCKPVPQPVPQPAAEEWASTFSIFPAADVARTDLERLISTK
jgi:pimeloyl-ACP methyl ester carboxylesterase